MIKRIKDIFLLRSLRVKSYKKTNLYLMLFLELFLILIKKYYLSNNANNISNVIIDITIVYFFLYLMTYFLKVVFASTYRKKNNIPKGNYDNKTIGINYILNLIFLVLFVSSIFIIFNIDVIKFLTISGLFFAGLAWVFKEHVINVTNGFIIMFSSSIKIGDYILINGFKGRITNIKLLNTEIITDEGDLTIIPNEILLRSEIINYSKTNAKRVIFDFDVTLQKLDLKKIERFLTDEEKKDKLIDNIDLKIGEIKSKSVNIIVDVSLTRYNFELDSKIKNNIKERVISYLLSK